MKAYKNNVAGFFFAWLLLILTGILLVISCTEEDQLPVADGAEGTETLVRLTVSVPAGSNLPSSTRSQTTEESQISEVQILAFENGIYKYRVTGIITESNSYTTTFNATLRSSNSVVKLYILANASRAFTNTEPVAGEDESSIKSKLVQHFTSSGIESDFPMFGEHTISEGLSAEPGNTITGIKMLRALARIDIINSATNFEFVSVQAFRVNSNIQVIPNYLSDPAEPEVSSPSVPNTSEMTIQTNSLSVANDSLISHLYLPESNAPATDALATEATCIVVGGYFNNSSTVTYYRIDFEDDPAGEILRNNCYTFTIIGVNLAGKDTANEAAENLATGIIATAQNWEDNQTNMIFDGEHYFGVSSRQVTLKYRAGSDLYIDVSTNLDSYELLWSDASSATDEETGASTIQNDYFDVEITDDGKRIHISALQNNKTLITQTSYMVILANRWKILIEIDQSNIEEQSKTNVNILSFGLGIGGFGGTYPGRINGGDAAGFRSLLLNTGNFGPDGVVPLGHIGLDYNSTTDKTDVLRQYLEFFDVINISYASSISADQANIILEWLASNEHRVLLVSRDATGTNTDMITAICGGTNMWAGGGAGKIFTPATPNDENDYFMNSGPFGFVDPTIDKYTFTPSDGIWLGISPTSDFASTLIPLLINEGGEYVISIDKSRRIVFCGDVGLYQSYTNGLDSSGSTNTPRAKLIANLWAWIIEEIVLPGKIA